MDKYIVRTPRHVTKVLREVRQEGPRVQSRLEALPGVVVVEELVRAKELLEREEEAEERKVKVLRQLLEKRPSTKLLEETRIGRTVRRLSEGEGEVARLASRLYKRWKREVERRVELSHTRIEVRSDKETERRRGAARALLDTALGREAGLAPAAREQLAARVEAQLFLACSSLIGGGYRRLVRRVVFGLGRQAVREEVVQGVRPVARLVREFMVEGRK